MMMLCVYYENISLEVEKGSKAYACIQGFLTQAKNSLWVSFKQDMVATYKYFLMPLCTNNLENFSHRIRLCIHLEYSYLF